MERNHKQWGDVITPWDNYEEHLGMAEHWVIKVRTVDRHGKPTVEYGRPTGGAPYRFINEQMARNAAQLWGDAYTRGDVWVEEEK